MTALVHFLSEYRLSWAGWAAAALYAGGLWAGLAALLYRVFDGRRFDAGKRRLLAAVALALAFEALAPLVPSRARGWRLWPSEPVVAAEAGRAVAMAGLGASAVWLGGAGRPAAVFGAALGFAGWTFGAYANRWLDIAQAASGMGRPLTGAGLTLALPLLAGASLLLAASAVQASRGRTALWVALLAAWAVPYHAAWALLAPRWGLGERDLASAAGLTRAAPERWGRLYLAGGRYAEEDLAVGGLPVTEENLRLVLGYLRYNRFRSQHAAEALEFLREGWSLRWDAERARRALTLHAPNAPPALLPFALLMAAAPVTEDNYRALRDAAALTERFPAPTAGKARRLYEALALSYAHFGDDAASRSWSRRVGRLYPLVPRAAPAPEIERRRGGRVAGRVSGLPEGCRLALLTSGLGAPPVLVDAGEPSAGRFEFAGLTPALYELAVTGPRDRLAGLRLSSGPPIVALAGEGELATADLAFGRELP